MSALLEEAPANIDVPPGDGLPPAIIFGGNDNALSLVRTLGARRIPVHVLNTPDSDVLRSRFGKPVTLPSDVPHDQAALDFLLGSDSEHLRGSVLLAAGDAALEALTEHREALSHKYRLDLCNPEGQRLMLDKLQTYRVAERAGVATPLFWSVQSRDAVAEIRDELVFPLIVKPRLSHVFQQKFAAKFLVAQTYDEVLEAMALTEREGIDVLLVEKIPGPDSQLCSYYTYLDESGAALFDFTKRIIRRHPYNMGLGCYHITDDVPGIREPALALFRGAGLQGLANAEFKLDTRDGVYKLIECNARFTAANGLVTRAGLDLGSLVYNRLVGLPAPPLSEFRSGLRLWDPFRDLKAFRELRAMGELTLWGWLRSIAHRQSFAAFAWTDPLPSLNRLRKRLLKASSRTA